MVSDLEVISSLYLPIDEGKLILPNVSVAEVIEYVRPEARAGLETAPEYFLGDIVWRGLKVPLFSFELLSGQQSPAKNTRVRIAVLNSVGSDPKKVPFISIVTQGLPRLVKVSKDLIQDEQNSESLAVQSVIRVDGEVATVPDLAYIESLALSLN